MNNAEKPHPKPPDQDAPTVRRVAKPEPLDLEVAKLTDVGRVRSHNEDYVDYFVPTDPEQKARRGAIYLVADGMGGHQAGEVASRGAVEAVIAHYYGDTEHDVGTSLVRAVRAANRQIYAQSQADPSKAGMGTTLVAVVILGRKVYVANVGDSRAYLINKRGISQITEDHSWVEEQVRAGLLTHEQASRHPQRNLVTRALGSKPDVQVDLFEGELNEGDTLLLCSDGLTGRVTDQEIAAAVTRYPPQEAARRLVALANERGGNDNITVLIVSAHAESPTVKAVPAALPVERESRKSPLLPIIAAGVAALLVLAMGGWLATRFFLPAENPTATPLPPTTATVVMTAPTIPSETVLPGGSPLATGTAATSPTAASSPTPMMTTLPLSPTSTLAPTPTPTIKPTLPPPTLTPTPSQTPEPARPAPTLVEPPSNADLSGQVTFKWNYPPRQLGLGNAFEVRIWKEGSETHPGAAEAVSTLEQTIDLDVLLPNRGGPGHYFWSVVVIRKSTGEALSPEAEPRPFTYTGP